MKFYVLVIAAVAYLAYVHGGKSVVNTKQMKYRLWYMYVYMRISVFIHTYINMELHTMKNGSEVKIFFKLRFWWNSSSILYSKNIIHSDFEFEYCKFIIFKITKWRWLSK